MITKISFLNSFLAKVITFSLLLFEKQYKMYEFQHSIHKFDRFLLIAYLQVTSKLNIGFSMRFIVDFFLFGNSSAS